MQPPYIPAKDADFATWLANFSSKITATPVAYGLIAGDATIIAAVATSFATAYALAIDPATRTQANIAGKDAARVAAIATVRPYAVSISLNSGVTNPDKLEVGVNLPNAARTPIPPPVTAPVLAFVSAIPGQTTIGVSDSSTPLSKAKPFGVASMELRQTLGTAIASDPNTAALVGLTTKSPTYIAYDPTDTGKYATVWGRWRTKSGPQGISQVGPWSNPLTYNVL